MPGKEVLCGNSLNAYEKIYVHTYDGDDDDANVCIA